MTSSPLVVAVLRYYGQEACEWKIIDGLRIVNNRRLAKRCNVDRAEMPNCGCMRAFVNTQEPI